MVVFGLIYASFGMNTDFFMSYMLKPPPTTDTHESFMMGWTLRIHLRKPMHPLVDTGLTWTLPCNSHPAPLVCCHATLRSNHDIIFHLTHNLGTDSSTFNQKNLTLFLVVFCNWNCAATLLYNDPIVWSTGLHLQEPPGNVQNYAQNESKERRLCSYLYMM